MDWDECALQVRQHSPHAGGVGFVNYGHFAKVAALGGAFVFEQMAFEGFTAHDFAGAGGTEALGCGAPGFEFGHEYIWFKTQLLIIPQDELSSVIFYA
jgi:hypothetical protein